MKGILKMGDTGSQEGINERGGKRVDVLAKESQHEAEEYRRRPR